MEPLLPSAYFLVGLAFLIVGANSLVYGASRLAAAAGVPPLTVGLTVVAFGTSAPELAVSARASLAGEASLAAGNVVGSNIFNVLLILGVCALIQPVEVTRQLIRRDVPVMVGVSALFLLLALNGEVSRLEGLGLVSCLVLYTLHSVRDARRETHTSIGSEYRGFRLRHLLAILGGLFLLVFGAQWLVEGASQLARRMGVSEAVIGLTLVSAGTSFPELATSIAAAFKGEREIAVGNVVGSNIFNILGVMGVSGIVSATGVALPQTMLSFDLPVMFAAAVACLPVFLSGGRIARWEGALFLLVYLGYIFALLLGEALYPGLQTLRAALILFVVPLSVVTFLAGRSNWTKAGIQ